MKFIFKLSPFWKSVGIIGGMIIGSGMFALPFAVQVSGFWGSLIGAAVALFAVLSIHLAYGEIVANTPGSHRLPGYANIYLGRWAGNFEKFAQVLGFNIILLVYGVLGGIFLSIIFGGSTFFWALVFFALGGVILLFGSIERIGWLNFVLSLPLVAATLIISFYAGSSGSFANISLSGHDPFFAFGIFIFSLTGLSVIADARSLFRDRADGKLKRSILTGTLFPFILYIIFIGGVLMISGSDVAEDALSGLAGVLGKEIVILGAIVGILAVFTSYLSLGYDLKSIFEFDIKTGSFPAWLLVAIVPIMIFALGAEDFTKLISIIGGMFIAFDGIFVIFILRSLRKRSSQIKHFLSFGPAMQVFLGLVFITSIIYELVYQVF